MARSNISRICLWAAACSGVEVVSEDKRISFRMRSRAVSSAAGAVVKVRH
jgi:hypothetical protein